MSRIYEALKRAKNAAAADGEHTGATVLRLDAIPVSPATNVADYPQETPGDPVEKQRQPERPERRNGVMRRIASVASRLNVPQAVEGKVVIDPSTRDASIEQYRRLA